MDDIPWGDYLNDGFDEEDAVPRDSDKKSNATPCKPHLGDGGHEIHQGSVPELGCPPNAKHLAEEWLFVCANRLSSIPDKTIANNTNSGHWPGGYNVQPGCCAVAYFSRHALLLRFCSGCNALIYIEYQ